VVSAPPGTAVPVALADPALETAVLGTLAEVEASIYAALATADPLVGEAARHLVDAGGKRFRPLLVALAAHLGDYRRPEVVSAAVVVELTHVATLYHDDVMDEAAVRRGSPSANARWDNSVAILTGDFLFACASKILADLGPDAVRIQAETFTRLVTGQIRETVGPRPGQDPLEHYMNVVTEKTASLMATSGQFGAMYAGAADEVIARIAPACAALGVAFQLSDDILDVSSDTDQSGKTPGTDLREGVKTLPVLHALRSPRPGDGRLIELLTGSDLTDTAARSETLELLRAHPAMGMAKADVRRWADLARHEILALPEVPARAAFETMCDFVMDRTG
jgi:heptaprenyl diphosphate synthase